MGGLYYPNQNGSAIIGSKSGTTLTESALTTAYSGNTSTVLSIGGMSKINLFVQYTSGASGTGNSIEVRIETGTDATNLYQLVNDSVSAGTSTLTRREFTYVISAAATTDNLVLPIDISDEFLRVAVKETIAAGSAGSVYVELLVSGR